MNHSKSGAVCIGAPKSAARFASEARHARESDQLSLLLLTDEGQAMLKRFANTQGADWQGIVNNGSEGDFLERKFLELCTFLAGVIFAFERI